jgi:hypothetical protein
LSFPSLFPDLRQLADTDAELDFFNNIAHLQLHRRSRAFMRLMKVSVVRNSLPVERLARRITATSPRQEDLANTTFPSVTAHSWRGAAECDHHDAHA